MFDFYNIEDIELGPASYSGHETYQRAVHKPANNKVIFKRNKHGKKQLSRLEVAFSQLARLFLANNLTSYQKIVLQNSKDIVGLVVQHLCYMIEKREGLQQQFFSLRPPLFEPQKIQAAKAEEIPIYFLDKFPQGFFNRLLQLEISNKLSIDYGSLASILTSSYTLEEDDLHKGNYGFYLVEKDNKPEVVFFKIDHDLMFVDSIMSFSTSRPYHLLHGAHAFDITARDLLSFPILKDSTNSYWPTKISHLPSYWDHKEYHHQAEVNAFCGLAENRKFIPQKWRAFYKHILIPTALLESSLKECLDDSKASDRADLALILQAMIGRQAQLKAVLFSIPEFRQFVKALTDAEQNSILSEILGLTPDDIAPNIKKKVADSFSEYSNLCQAGRGFVEGDTPLHIAIRLGDYRYDETMQMFGDFINIANGEGKTPLDLAREMTLPRQKTKLDVRQDLRLTMAHLLDHGARKNEAFNAFNATERVADYRFSTAYQNRSHKAKSYQELKAILSDIGEDHSFCLKFKKTIALECLSSFIFVNAKNPQLGKILMALKSDLGGTSNPERAAGLLYIRQLRTKLWIIRQIRGLYGHSSTFSEMNGLIDNAIRDTQPSVLSSCSLFNSVDGNKQHILNDRPAILCK